MDYVDQVEKIIKKFKELAGLQKTDLGSTAEMPNYNASYTQILKLKKIFSSNSDQAAILNKIDTLLTGSLAEMTDELPKMIAAENQEAAFVVYEQIKENFVLIKNSICDELSILASNRSRI